MHSLCRPKKRFATKLGQLRTSPREILLRAAHSAISRDLILRSRPFFEKPQALHHGAPGEERERERSAGTVGDKPFTAPRDERPNFLNSPSGRGPLGLRRGKHEVAGRIGRVAHVFHTFLENLLAVRRGRPEVPRGIGRVLNEPGRIAPIRGFEARIEICGSKAPWRGKRARQRALAIPIRRTGRKGRLRLRVNDRADLRSQLHELRRWQGIERDRRIWRKDGSGCWAHPCQPTHEGEHDNGGSAPKGSIFHATHLLLQIQHRSLFATEDTHRT
jgi:hypothetical protein